MQKRSLRKNAIAPKIATWQLLNDTSLPCDRLYKQLRMCRIPVCQSV